MGAAGATWQRVAAVLVGALAMSAIGGASGAAKGNLGACSRTHWVGSWGASPSNNGSSTLDDQTIRMIVAPHLAGHTVRVGFSNRFGSRPLVLRDVRIATVAKGREIRPGSDTRLRFGGSSTLRLQPGQDQLSDPVRFGVRPFRKVAVSAYSPRTVHEVTEHHTSSQISYLGAPGSGDKADQVSGRSLNLVTARWLIVDELVVRAPAATGAVVAFGDSITDGLYSGVNADARYPDHLTHRLARAGIPLSPVNAGITGNILTLSEPPSSPSGPSALERLDSDVLLQPGASDAIVLEGINELRQVGPAATIDGLKRIVRRLRRGGITVVLGTLTPASSTVDGYRRRVNRWIRRRSGVAVADFDRALRDPSDPSRLARRYDSGDGVHPSPRGYAALARAVPLGALKLPSCG